MKIVLPVSNLRSTSKISLDQLKAAAVVLFFSEPFIKWILGCVLGGYAGYITIVLPFIPIFLLFLVQRNFGGIIDFFLLLIGVCSFFALTYIIHPNYAFWYERSYYGIWDYVLRPDNGIYAYLFLRLIDDPKKILKCLKISAFFCFIYYAKTLLHAAQVGYWETMWNGKLTCFSYSLEFGYDLLPYALVFLYSALKSKKLWDWILATLGVIMILGGGSRGPALDIFIFLALYFLTEIQQRRNKVLIILLTIFAATVLYFMYVPLLNLLALFFNRIGLSSRFITRFLAGSIADDNGRAEIWKCAVQMIRDNPFGYGAMGSRHIIYNIIHVGHPHNIFLEFLIDYGVFLGTIMIIGGIAELAHLLRMSDIGEWKGLLLIYIGVSSQLLLSGTYWHRTGIWALLAITISIHKKRTKELYYNG